MVTIHSFRLPDESARDLICQEICKLAITDRSLTLLSGDCESADWNNGGQVEIVDQLMKRLHNDYADNIVEEQSSPWFFEYVLQCDEDTNSELAVMTRIFSNDPTQGSIYYGHRIRKLSNSDYWICFSG